MKTSSLLKHFLVMALTWIAALMARADNITDLPIKIIDGRSYYAYAVQPKETVFSITHKFNITADQLLKFNPAVRDGLKAYSTLYFPADIFGDTDAETTHTATSDVPTQHQETETDDMPVPAGYRRVTIQRGQSLFGIARENGITVEQLLAANPEINSSSYRAGQSILVPLPTTPEPRKIFPAKRDLGETPQAQPQTVSDIAIVTVEETDTDRVDTLSIALMLPFEANAANPSRLARLYTEFYRGFLLGVEQQSRQGQPLRVRVFDTAGDPANFNTILNSDDVASTDLFIGLDNEAQLTALASRANDTGAYILNLFVVKDELFHTNPSIIQTNLPRDDMYAGAIDEFIKIIGDREVVFLARVDGEADKVPFTEQLKDELHRHNIKSRDIVYRGVLTTEDMTQLAPGGDYAVIPVSASRNEFGKFIPGLRDFKKEADAQGGTIRLLGYPDWTTFRGDQLDNLHEFNTVIYSRFYNANTPEVRAVKANYNSWYGEDWSDVEPNQALLGYDIARFAINSLRETDGDFFPAASQNHRGLQNSFILVKPYENSGYVNSALYIVTFTPAGDVDVRIKPVDVTPKLAQ